MVKQLLAAMVKIFLNIEKAHYIQDFTSNYARYSSGMHEDFAFAVNKCTTTLKIYIINNSLDCNLTYIIDDSSKFWRAVCAAALLIIVIWARD